VTKEKEQLQSQAEQLKKDLDARAQDLKKSQDQLAKLQADLKSAQTNADKYAKDAKVLQAKLNKINEGEDEAADLMIRQLAEARRQLKQDQSTRQKLEQELDQLKQQSSPQ
jgi:chromosome segregation ATPase